MKWSDVAWLAFPLCSAVGYIIGKWESGPKRISGQAEHGPAEIPGTGYASSASEGDAGGSRWPATTKRPGLNQEGQVPDSGEICWCEGTLYPHTHANTRAES